MRFMFVTTLLVLLSTIQASLGGRNEEYEELQKRFPQLNEKKKLHLGNAPDAKLYEKTEMNVSMIVIHSTRSTSLSNLVNTLNTKNSSVHFIVDRTGVLCLQVPLPQCAHHARNSYAHVFIKKAYKSLSDEINHYAIGIDLVNSGPEPYPVEQMDSLKNLLIYLRERFSVRKDMIFGAADISTVKFNKRLENYVLSVTNPNKLFDWDFLAQNKIVVPVNIATKDAQEKYTKVLYKFGDKRTPLKSLKRRLNDLHYKINPSEDKNGIQFDIEKQDSYSDEFDVPFLWVVYQFSIRHLPNEIKKNLISTLEEDDVRFPFSDKYEHKISDLLSNLSAKVETKITSKSIKDNLSKVISTYGNDISGTILIFNSEITIDHNSSLSRFFTTPDPYDHMKNIVFSSIETLNKELLEIVKKGDQSKLLSTILNDFRSKISQVFDEYENDKFENYKKVFEQEFMSSLKSQIVWTELHKMILKEVEAPELL